jgi:hypothetical protein
LSREQREGNRRALVVRRKRFPLRRRCDRGFGSIIVEAPADGSVDGRIAVGREGCEGIIISTVYYVDDGQKFPGSEIARLKD